MSGKFESLSRKSIKMSTSKRSLGLVEPDNIKADEVKMDFQHQMRNITINEAMKWRREAMSKGEYKRRIPEHWSERLKKKRDIPPKSIVPLPRDAGVCTWIGENEQGWRYVCNNSVIRNEVTGEVMKFCAYHVPKCIMAHPTKESAVIHVMNDAALCRQHYVAVYDETPFEWESPWVVPGVLRKVRKREKKRILSHPLSPHFPVPIAPELPLAPDPSESIWGKVKVFYRRATHSRRIKKNGPEAARLQAVFRGYMTRKYVRYMKLEIQGRERLQAVLNIQAIWRGKLERIRFKRLKESSNASALLIQRIFRGMRDRKRINRNLAAAKIQRNWRGYAGRLVIRALHKQISVLHSHLDDEWAATTIQRYFRGSKGRSKVKQIREAFWKRHLSACILQRSMRVYVRRVVEARQKAYQDGLIKAVLKIQTAWRRYRAMKLLRWMRLAFENSARVIQRMWRGYCGRLIAIKLQQEIEEVWQWLNPSLPRATFGHFLAKHDYGRPDPLTLPRRQPWESNKIFRDSVADLMLSQSGQVETLINGNTQFKKSNHLAEVSFLLDNTDESESANILGNGHRYGIESNDDANTTITAEGSISTDTAQGLVAVPRCKKHSSLLTEEEVLEAAGKINDKMWPNDLFSKWDPANLGVIPRTDFKKALIETKGEFVSGEDIIRIITKFDLKGNGFVSYVDFLKFARRQSYPCTAHRSWVCVRCICYGSCTKCPCNKFKSSSGNSKSAMVCSGCGHYMAAHQQRPKSRADKLYREGEVVNKQQMRMAMGEPRNLGCKPDHIKGIQKSKSLSRRNIHSSGTSYSNDGLGAVTLYNYEGGSTKYNSLPPRAATCLAKLASQVGMKPSDIINLSKQSDGYRAATSPVFNETLSRSETPLTRTHSSSASSRKRPSTTVTILNGGDGIEYNSSPSSRQSHYRRIMKNAREDRNLLSAELKSNHLLSPRHISDGFTLADPVSLIVDGELKVTNDVNMLYLDTLLMFADTELEIIEVDCKFYKLAFNLYVFLQRHWKKLCSDLRTGTLNSNLEIDESLKKYIESQLLPQPKRATKLNERFITMGFSNNKIGVPYIHSNDNRCKTAGQLSSVHRDLKMNQRQSSSFLGTSSPYHPPSRPQTSFTIASRYTNLLNQGIRPVSNSSNNSSGTLNNSNSNNNSRPSTRDYNAMSREYKLEMKSRPHSSNSLINRSLLSTPYTRPGTTSRPHTRETTTIPPVIYETLPEKTLVSDRLDLLSDDGSVLSYNYLEPLTPKVETGSKIASSSQFNIQNISQTYHDLATAPRDGSASGMITVSTRNTAPIVCSHPGCGKHFTTSIALDSHQLEAHDGRYRLVTTSTPEIDQRMSKYWPVEHPWNSALQEHTNDRPGCRFSCPVCDKRFIRESHMDTHMRVFHRMSYRQWEAQDPNITWLGAKWCVPPRKSPERARIPVCPEHWGTIADDRCKACNISRSGLYPALPARFYQGVEYLVPTGRITFHGKLEYTTLQISVGDGHYAVIIIDPITGCQRIARVIALCQDKNNKSWAAVYYFWTYEAAKATLDYNPTSPMFDKEVELLEDNVVQYIDLKCIFGECLVLSVNSKRDFVKNCESDRRIERFIHKGGAVYYCRERFDSKTSEPLPKVAPISKQTINPSLLRIRHKNI